MVQGRDDGTHDEMAGTKGVHERERKNMTDKDKFPCNSGVTHVTHCGFCTNIVSSTENKKKSNVVYYYYYYLRVCLYVRILDVYVCAYLYVRV